MILRGVKLHNYTSKLEEIGPVYRLHFSAEPSSNVCEEMRWDVLDAAGNVSEGTKSIKLLGIVRISDFTLTPHDPGMANHAIAKFGALEMRNFELSSRIEDEQRVSELRFIVIVSGAIGKIDKFWRIAGKVPSLLEVSVIEQQMDLETEEAEESEATEKPIVEEEVEPRRRKRTTKAVPIDQQ
jgi:hypothetical protein